MSDENLDPAVDRKASEAEEALERLERHSEEVGERVEDAKRDWRAKQEDDAIPGAQRAGEGGDTAGDWGGEAQAADEAGQ
jgi:hypothetical protein